MKCKNASCLHHRIGKHTCEYKASELSIDVNGRCAKFEKGLLHYIFAVDDAMRNTNFITADSMTLTLDVRRGAYYLMEIYDVSFSEYKHGNFRMIFFEEPDSRKRLTFKQIVAREVNLEKIMQFVEDIGNGIFPDQKMEATPPKKAYQPFGWLSPTGVFTEGDFGEHEKVAYAIIKEKGFIDEYKALRDEKLIQARDYLSDVKGYCLVHNPSGTGDYIVSHTKKLTKSQNEFLYGYFADMGDTLMANQFANDN